MSTYTTELFLKCKIIHPTLITGLLQSVYIEKFNNFKVSHTVTRTQIIINITIYP